MTDSHLVLPCSHVGSRQLSHTGNKDNYRSCYSCGANTRWIISYASRARCSRSNPIPCCGRVSHDIYKQVGTEMSPPVAYKFERMPSFPCISVRSGMHKWGRKCHHRWRINLNECQAFHASPSGVVCSAAARIGCTPFLREVRQDMPRPSI